MSLMDSKRELEFLVALALRIQQHSILQLASQGAEKASPRSESTSQAQPPPEEVSGRSAAVTVDGASVVGNAQLPQLRSSHEDGTVVALSTKVSEDARADAATEAQDSAMATHRRISTNWSCS
jgi:hypothetical protein